MRTVAAFVAVVSVAMGGLSLVLQALQVARGDVRLDQAQTLIGVAILAAAFPVVGWIVLRREPHNAVGWVYLAVGFWQSLNLFASGYSTIAFETAGGNLPLAPELSWIAVWAWTPGFTLFCTLGVLLFPDGHLPSRRWWPVVAVAAVAIVLLALPVAVALWPYRGLELVQAAHEAQPQIPPGSGVEMALALSSVGQLLVLVGMVGSVAGLVARFRRSVGVEREQMKWFTYAALLDVAVLIVWMANILDPLENALSALLFAPALPIAIGIAILRYRLYDIDRIISRSLVYGLLTAVLAGLYAATVGLMQRVSHAATGADSDAAIVITTLIVVTAFTPLKNWLQHHVDRRFASGRDPRAALLTFTDMLRDSVSAPDPQRTLRRLLSVVVESCDLAGGTIVLEGPDGASWSSAQGRVEATSVEPEVILAVGGDAIVRLQVAPRRPGLALAARDRAAVEDALAITARELDLF